MAEVKKLRVGHGLEKVHLGPMVTQLERAKFEEKIKKAIAEGAHVETGGGRPAGLDQGFWWFPYSDDEAHPG